LVHISQLSAGYVRDPHDVVAVGDQVRVWVASIDKERRRVALTMIAPGTERPRPEKSRRPRRRPEQPQSRPQPSEGEAAAPAQERKSLPPRRPGKPRHDRRGRRDAPRPQRTGAYEKRAAKTLVPITKAMEEGKEFMRSFGDLLQFHKKKKEQDEPVEKAEQGGGTNGSTENSQESRV
jgi:hypothetical protein